MKLIALILPFFVLCLRAHSTPQFVMHRLPDPPPLAGYRYVGAVAGYTDAHGTVVEALYAPPAGSGLSVRWINHYWNGQKYTWQHSSIDRTQRSISKVVGSHYFTSQPPRTIGIFESGNPVKTWQLGEFDDLWGVNANFDFVTRKSFPPSNGKPSRQLHTFQNGQDYKASDPTSNDSFLLGFTNSGTVFGTDIWTDGNGNEVRSELFRWKDGQRSVFDAYGIGGQLEGVYKVNNSEQVAVGLWDDDVSDGFNEMIGVVSPNGEMVKYGFPGLLGGAIDGMDDNGNVLSSVFYDTDPSLLYQVLCHRGRTYPLKQITKNVPANVVFYAEEMWSSGYMTGSFIERNRSIPVVFQPVPEPTSLAVFIAGLGLVSRRATKKSA